MTAAALLGAVVAFGACTDDGGDAGSAGRAAGEQADEGSVSTADALRIVEQGFSTFAHPRTGEALLSFGFVIENTAEVTFDSVVVNIHMYDSSGAELQDPDLGHADVRDILIGRLGPGDVIGAGDIIGFFPGQPAVDRIELRVGEPPLDPSVDEDPPRGELTTTGSRPESDRNCAWTAVTVASTYDIDLPAARAYAVYRNERGRIVGGAEGRPFAIPAGGDAETRVNVDPLWGCMADGVPGASSTEVYVDPGLVPGD